MATIVTIKRQGIKASFTGDQIDSITIPYRVQCDPQIYDPRAVLYAAQTAVEDLPNHLYRVPFRREQYAGGGQLFADKFEVSVHDEDLGEWGIDVEFTTPPAGDQNNLNLHPLLRPPKIKIDYIDKEVAVTRAYNLEEHEAITAQRDPLTLGPITNALATETKDPVVETIWNPVLSIARAVADLDAVINANKTYQWTTNSDTLLNRFPPRTAKYQVTRSGDQEEQDGIPYYDIVTSIELMDTTDVYINNVSYDYIDAADNDKLKTFKDDEGEDVKEPKFINFDGTPSSVATSLGYRYLNPIPYTPLVT